MPEPAASAPTPAAASQGAAATGDPAAQAGPVPGSDTFASALTALLQSESAASETTPAPDAAATETPAAADWKSAIDKIDPKELLRHPRIAGIVGDAAQKRAAAEAAKGQGAKVAEDNPSFAADWQGFSAEQRAAWLQAQPEHMDALRGAVADVASDLAGLLDADLDALRAAGGDPAKLTAALLAGKAVQTLVADAEKKGREAGRTEGREEGRRAGGSPPGSEAATPAVQPPTTFKEASQGFAAALASLA
jgi:hypothetical protein